MHVRAWIVIAALAMPATPAFADDGATEPPTGESKRGWFAVGAGYNPDDGFIAHAGVGNDDLFGTGHHLRLDAQLSALGHRSAMAYEVPDLLGTGLELRGELFAERRALPRFTREAAGGAVTLAKRFGAVRVYARYGVEHVRLDPLDPLDPRDATAARLAEPGALAGGDGVLATLGGGVEYTTLDTPWIPRRGTRLHAWAERASARWGSDHELERGGVELAHARPLGPFTLRLSGHATHVRSPAGPVPLAHRLLHDGHAEVRGYTLDRGPPFGDTTEAAGTVELELPIWSRAGLSLAGWADAGWRSTGSLLQRSAGLSIIWRSPIGPLRLDWAKPLDGADRDMQVLFSLGGAF